MGLFDELQIDNIELKKEIFDILLKDRTTGKNIIYATNSYGEKYNKKFTDEITLDDIINNPDMIIPRYKKTKTEQKKRTAKKAEVFTPTWLCNKMNNLIDNEWFGRENVFNIEKEKSWETNKNKITFPVNKTPEDYINSTRLEITCGEAPFITSRYDTVTGRIIPFENRIGILDRKLRVAKECFDNKSYMLFVVNSFKAYRSVYGYEYQGDNLLIARVNLMNAFIDVAVCDSGMDRFNSKIFNSNVRSIAKYISYNLWQMDGLKDVIPNTNIKAKIMDWENNNFFAFESLKKEGL